MMRLLVISLPAFVVAVPYLIPSNTLDLSLVPREAAAGSAGSSCQTPGAVSCNGQKLIGECGGDNTVVWLPVPEGTICQCTSPGACSIAIASEAVPDASNPGTASSTATPSETGQPASAAPAFTSASSHAPSQSGNPKAGSSSAYAPPASASSSASAPSSSSGGSGYHIYNGDGSVQDGWPPESSWKPFDDLWNGYSKVLGRNCETAFGVPNNTPEETAAIKAALQSESSQAGIPVSFSFAIMMQESLGCAHVATTNYGVSNPGLFQSHDGSGTCSDTSDCPTSEIQQMVHDGIFGTASGDGLVQLVKQEGSNSTGAAVYYRAARLYNSGSIAPGGDLGQGIATHCYCMDVANRLMGQWFDGPTKCTLDG